MLWSTIQQNCRRTSLSCICLQLMLQVIFLTSHCFLIEIILVVPLYKGAVAFCTPTYNLTSHYHPQRRLARSPQDLCTLCPFLNKQCTLLFFTMHYALDQHDFKHSCFLMWYKTQQFMLIYDLHIRLITQAA